MGEQIMPSRESLGSGLGFIAGTISSIRDRDPETARQLQWIYDNVDQPKITKQEVEDVVNFALLDTLRRNSLLEVLRIVCSVRWGSVGRTLADREKRTSVRPEDRDQ